MKPKHVAKILYLFSVAFCGAQATAQPAVPIEQEPAHRLVLQNDSVRVFEVRLGPGQETLWHVHRQDGISVRLADASIEDQPQEGQAESLQLRRGAVAFGATPTALTHKVRNVGTTVFHNIYIELPAAADGGNRGRSPPAPGQEVAFENDRVRALRRTLAPGEATAVHTHAVSCVAVLVTPGELEISSPERAVRTRAVKPGDLQWIDAGTTHALKNVGDTPIEIVDVEPE